MGANGIGFYPTPFREAADFRLASIDGDDPYGNHSRGFLIVGVGAIGVALLLAVWALVAGT